MQSQNELRNLLQRIDHKSYPAYKDTRGSYDFGNYVLSIDHVQGDPFAAPSKVSVHVRGTAAKFPADLYRMKCRRLAVCDYLLRRFGQELERVSFKAKGSGKSGLLSTSSCSQEILKRTSLSITEKEFIARFEVGFPANGRTINAPELEKIFFDFSWGLTYFLKLHIIIVQGGQRRVSAKALKHNSVPECLVMQSFQ